MKKPYDNKEMTTERATTASGRSAKSFFFPKHNPPVSIEAETQEEADAKLLEQDNPTK